MKLSVETPNFEPVFVELDKRVVSVLDLARDKDDYAAVLRSHAKGQFDSEGGQSGGWIELSDATLEQKARKYGPGKKIGRASDALYLSLTGETKDSILDATKEELHYGTRAPQGIWMQLGTDNMEARVLLVITPALVADVKKTAIESAEKVLSG
jgi:hypothetical protein